MRQVLRSSAFLRAAKRLVKSDAAVENRLRTAVEKLAEDAFHPSLRTHKLKGELDGVWSCSAGYDLRILFEFTEHEGAEVILLLTIGTHDEVY